MHPWPPCPTIYEINAWTWLRELSERHKRQLTLADVPQGEWDSIARWNTDAVWLMGVWERSPEGRRIALAIPGLLEEYRRALPDFRSDDVVGSPFCVHRTMVDAHLGGEEGLAAAREALRARGLRLMLDFVPNHIALDHPWVREHPEYLVQGNANDLKHMPDVFFKSGDHILAHGKDLYCPAWTDTIQVNPFQVVLRTAMVETVTTMARQCDGVRCDMAMLPVSRIARQIWGERVGSAPAREFWEELIEAVKRDHPDFLFIAEAYWDMEWELQQQGFDLCYDKRLYDRLLHASAEAVLQHLKADLSYQKRLVRFVENHDEPRAAAVFGPKKAHAAAVVAATVPGAKLFHHGQFEGWRVKLPVQLGRQPTEAIDSSLQDFYERLLAETAAPVYREGSWQLCERSGWPDNASWRRLLAWCYLYKDERRLVVVNFADQPSQGLVHVPWPDLKGRSCRLRDVFTGDLHERSGDAMIAPGLYVGLPPYGVHCFHVKVEF